MGFALVPLLVAALLCEPIAASILQRTSGASVGPAFVWGSVPVLQTDGQQASRVIYEVSISRPGFVKQRFRVHSSYHVTAYSF